MVDNRAEHSQALTQIKVFGKITEDGLGILGGMNSFAEASATAKQSVAAQVMVFAVDWRWRRERIRKASRQSTLCGGRGSTAARRGAAAPSTGKPSFSALTHKA